MSTPAVTVAPAATTNVISNDPEYRKTGVMPAPKTADPAPAPESSEPDVEAEAETEGESAAAPEAAHQEPQKPKRNAETRIRELVAKTRELEAKLDEARRGKETPKAESSPAPKEPAKQAEAPKKPEAKDFDKYDDYEAAKDKYFEDLADYRAKEAVANAETERQQREALRTMQEKIDDARKRYPDYDEKAFPFFKKLVGEQNENGLIRARLDKSTVMVDLIYVLAGDDAKAAAFLEAAKSDPLSALDELVLTERLVKEELAKSGEKAPEKNTPKPPPPPSEVSGKGTPPADELEEARKAADGSPEKFARYKALADARDLKARGSRR